MDRRRVFELSQDCRVKKLGQSDVSVEIQIQLSLLREEKKPDSVYSYSISTYYNNKNQLL